jgi:hypothetical protein
VIGTVGNSKPIWRYDDMPPIRGMTGDWEACALYAGQSVGVVQSVSSAGQVVQTVADQAVSILHRLSSLDPYPATCQSNSAASRSSPPTGR